MVLRIIGLVMVAAGTVNGGVVTYSNLTANGSADPVWMYESGWLFPTDTEIGWRFIAAQSGTLMTSRASLWRSNVPAQAVLRLYEDGGTTPGLLIGSWTLTLPAQPLGMLQARVVDLPTGPYLHGGTPYYITVQKLGDPTQHWRWLAAYRSAGHPQRTMGAERHTAGGEWVMYENSDLPAFELTVEPCGTADFNGDGVAGTDQDIEAFFACLGGNCCPGCFPGGSDFNGDGDAGTDQDIESFFRVLGGGAC